jgi:hypothetical protein
MTTTNMSLSLPTVSVTAGPTWASQLNAALETIDVHDHSSGKGVRITPAGMTIDDDLDFDGNNIDDLRALRLGNQSSALGSASDVRCVYVYGGDLYYNNASGTQIQLTSGAQVSASGGSTSNTWTETSVSSNHTISASDTYVVLKVSTAATRTITLPLASAVSAGRFFLIKDSTGSGATNAITLSRAGSDTIDGASSQSLSIDYGAWFVVSDGTSAWHLVRGAPSFLTKSSLSLLAAGTISIGAAGSMTIGSALSVSDSTVTIGNSSLTTTTLTVNTNSSLTSTALTVGASAASAGYVRIPASGSIKARNAANSGDVQMIAVSGSNHINIGDPSSPSSVPYLNFHTTKQYTNSTLELGSSATIQFASARSVARAVPARPTHISTSGGVTAETALGAGIVFGVMATSAVKITTGYCETQLGPGSERYVYLLDPGPWAWIDGATLATATLYYHPRSGHVGLPSKYPAISITRASYFGGTEEFLLSSSGGWQIDSGYGSVVAYEAAQALSFVPDQNATIDLANYSYMIRVADEVDGSGSNGLKFYAVKLNFTVTDFTAGAL